MLTRPLRVTATLLAAALVAWVVAAQRMRGMDAGPGTDLGGLGWYLGIWVTMTAAMMLPSAAPMVITYARAARDARTWVFVLGYLVAWTGYGLAAYGLYRLVARWAPGWVAWDREGPYVAGAALGSRASTSSRRSRRPACAAAAGPSATSCTAGARAGSARCGWVPSTASSASAAAGA